MRLLATECLNGMLAPWPSRSIFRMIRSPSYTNFLDGFSPILAWLHAVSGPLKGTLLHKIQSLTAPTVASTMQHNFVLFIFVFLLSALFLPSTLADDTDYSCSATKPCSNGACCGASGFCGKYLLKACRLVFFGAEVQLFLRLWANLLWHRVPGQCDHSYAPVYFPR